MIRLLACILVCVLAACAGAPAAAPAESTRTEPPVLTRTSTPVRELSPTMAAGNPAADRSYSTPTASPRPQYSSPTPTPTLTVRQFDPGEIFIAVVREGWIYAVNLAKEVMPLWNLAADPLINGDSIHMEISPDRKFLAMSGIGADGRPALEVLDLATQQMTAAEVFAGTAVADYAWSPDSRKLAAVVTTVHGIGDFDGAAFLIEAAGREPREMLFLRKGSFLRAIRWPRVDRIAYVDFNCQGAISTPSEENSYQAPNGTIGVNVYDLASRKTVRRDMGLTYSYRPRQNLDVSPDGSHLMFRGSLLELETLQPVPCIFCDSVSGDAIWFGDFVYVSYRPYGSVDGYENLIDTSNGFSRPFGFYGTFDPNPAIDTSQGTAILLDYYAYEGNGVVAMDFQACLGDDWNMHTCRKYLWGLESQWPSSHNIPPKALDVRCVEVEQ